MADESKEQEEVPAVLRCVECAEPLVQFVSALDGETRYHHDYSAINTKIGLMRSTDNGDPLRMIYDLVCTDPVLVVCESGTYDGSNLERIVGSDRHNVDKGVNAAMSHYYFEELSEDPESNWLDFARMARYGVD